MSSPDTLMTDDFLPAAYPELCSVARRCCEHLPWGRMIDPNALVHEVWLRMRASSRGAWASRAQFFAATARLMRFILVDRARQRSALKHGGGLSRQDLSTEIASNSGAADDVHAIHELLEILEAEEPRAAQYVKLRFFAGKNVKEAAEVLQVSTRTARRDWSVARAWLRRKLSDNAA